MKNNDGDLTYGIYLFDSSNNMLSRNKAFNNNYGIYLNGGKNNNITQNNLSNNGFGITMDSWNQYNTINFNYIQNNLMGIYLNRINFNNIFISNNISSNNQGIHIGTIGFDYYINNHDNVFLNNTIKSNVNYGIYNWYPGDNYFYNNYFNNQNNSYFLYSIHANFWNTTKTPGINIVEGPYMGGNFWANPSGTGFSENCADVNKDGICDSTYLLDSNNIDYLPLAKFTISRITVVSPNEGETWPRGTSQTIRWTYSGTPGSNVRIELLKGGVLNRIINSSVPIGSSGSGSYSWLINSTQTLGTDYKVRITSTTNPAYTDASNNNFMITGGIAVTSPNGGEIWPKGTTQTIRWTYSGTPGSNVRIELLKNGVLNRTINSSVPIGGSGSGSYNWLVNSTQAVGTDYKVRITSTTNAAYTDASNNNFMITGGIAVTSPNGGETWPRGTMRTIRWTYSGTPGSNVRIELLKGGVLNRTINSSVPIGSSGSGSYNWLVNSTQTIGTDYKVRITSTTNAAYTDASNNNFTIPAIPTGYSYIYGKVMNNNAGIAGALVITNTSVSTTTDASGFYSLLVHAGKYSLTGTKEPAYYKNSSVVVTAISGTAVLKDIIITRKLTGIISGKVRSD